MRRWISGAVGLLTALAGADAGADSLATARSQPLREVSHAVDVRIVDGVARYTVRRSFANAGTVADEATVAIDLPPGAAATGLRIRARDRWYRGDLMEAEEAREKYQELTGLGAWQAKDPALLQWAWADSLRLQVFPVLAGSANTVEYTLTAPVRYRQGRYVIAYPRAVVDEGDEASASLLADPVIRIHPGHGDAATPIFVDGQRVIIDAPVVLKPPPEPVWRGEGYPDTSASYVHSKIPVEGLGTARAAKLELAIDHTYSGDLEVELVTPQGRRLTVDSGRGGDNDIRGSFEVELPAETTIGGDWYLSVSDRAGLDVGTLERWSIAFDARPPKAEGDAAWSRARASLDTPIFIPDAPDGDGGGLALIEVAPPEIDTLDARLGRVVASADKSFFRVEVDAAPELRPLPRGASVVFVVDASRSLGPAEIMRQVDVARAYVSHVPDAKVEIVAFRRRAERVFGDFIPATELAQGLADGARQRLAPGNGSALDEGLRLAGELLRGRRGPTRIVVVSDARLRSRLSVDDGVEAAKRAPRSTITHLVIPRDGVDVRLERDDAYRLAALPASRGGVLYRLEFDASTSDKELARAALGLVRPIALENFAVDTDDAEGLDVPSVLREGEGFRAMVARAKAPRRVVVRGMLWGEEVRREVRATRAFSQATAAFVFSEDEYDDLSDDEMMRVARFGRAVSPVTSYLATEPGVRPSTIGLDLVGMGSGGGGASGSSIGFGGAGGRAHRKSFTLEELVAPGVARCKAEHRASPTWRLDLRVETTSREIVDVIPSRPATTPLDACVVEAIWETELSWNFTSERELRPLALR
ncbi:MAG: proprotein convertase P-domain-containing protein [Myxococcales bacterium]|nr:proprotein convertase P-domain-containing protein [Myxococcales bacterium]